MAYHSGGRVTVNHRTYEDKSTSGVVKQYDRYLRTTVTNAKSRKMTAGPVAGAAVAEAVSREAVTHTAAASAPFR